MLSTGEPDTPLPTVLQDLGQRLERFRLAQNLRQEDVAREAGVSRITVGKLESGHGGSLETFLRVMRALGLGDRLADLVPDTPVAPMQMQADRVRQRARRARPDTADAPWTWGEE